MEDQTKHYLISGLVQGVGFRRFVERTASILRLRGWVRNLNDGRVEAWVQGPKETLTEFERHLRNGPSNSRVDSLIVTEKKGSASISSFAIKNDGDQPCVGD